MLGAATKIWKQSLTLSEGQESHDVDFSLRDTKVLYKKVCVHLDRKGSNQLTIHS
jgi:hypothetical protein